MDEVKEMKSKKLTDFKCKRAESSGFSDEIIAELNLEFPKSYENAEIMAKISKSIKKESESQICILPFCHTVEAEAFGAFINLSEGKFGPRAASYAYQSVEELLDLQDVDFNQGRISEVLKACQILYAQGEKVALEISGFLTILNSLIDVSKIFKAWRKEPEKIEKVFEILSDNLYRVFEEAKKVGVSIASYADPASSVNIVGPKFTEKMATKFTYPLLKRVADLSDDNFIIHLCPKTSLIFFDLGLAERKTLLFNERLSYNEACLKVIGKEKVIGQACIKDTKSILCHGKIIALNFI
ncbi:methylcobamide--CoM methyltransferase [Acetobacterium paludosum]|uniref:Methylcobamide--CoM methyltransferase n=1 Tax=Acetobacterium paludosum TaxID=52693 RepID=A0A923KXK5_9FIRM|nr:uroporphyrinogen decarboxylase family protein [Acetobacterium paludosum]MBC3889700.1 methylcobamide--CoM methyltransferase [Acetobacterium paludosum]